MPTPPFSPADRKSHGLDLVLLAALALFVRLVFFNGPFGSDDVVYLQRALETARGEWTSSNYNGALRYAFNLPAGLFVFLFGESTAAANLWPLLCSLTEVLLVYLVAADIWGRRAGVFAGMVLAFMPLHISVASRIHVDAVVSLALSAAFALLYFGSVRNKPWLLFGSGIALGVVYWAKELAAVVLLAFFVFPLLWRRMPPGWPYVLCGGLVMLVAHLALMWAIAGDPLHMFKVALSHSFIRDGVGDGSAWYYFRYLLLDLRHTSIASLLAVVAVLLIVADRSVRWKTLDGRSFAVLWFLSVLGILSFFPVSLSPLRFAMKQSNYLTLFLAPIAVLAGYLLARLPRGVAGTGLAVSVLAGTVLAGLQQADYRAFPANNKTAYLFAQQHLGHAVIGSRSTASVAAYYAQLEPLPERAVRIDSYKEAMTPDQTASIAQSTAPTYMVWDPSTQEWAGGDGGLQQPLACWQRVSALQPSGLAWTNRAVAALAEALASMSAPQALVQRLQRLGAPEPATVYAVIPQDPWCRSTQPASPR